MNLKSKNVYASHGSLGAVLDRYNLDQNIENLKLLDEDLNMLNKEIIPYNDTIFELKRKKEAILWAIEQQKEKKLKEEFKLTVEHIKLLQNMEFKGLWCGDIVSIGVDGKRPFGNSSIYTDIASILEWKLPNDYLSDKQYAKAKKIVR